MLNSITFLKKKLKKELKELQGYVNRIGQNPEDILRSAVYISLLKKNARLNGSAKTVTSS